MMFFNVLINRLWCKVSGLFRRFDHFQVKSEM